MRKLKIFLLFVVCSLWMAGCGKVKETEIGSAVYYLNKDATSIVPVAYEITGETMEKQVEELNARLTEEESLREMYEKRLSDYESDVIGGRVKIVTIYCTWDDEDSTKRQIRVLTSDKEFSPVNLTAENQENGYARLNQMLVDYITENSDSVVVLSLNTEKILYRDQTAINDLMGKLTRKYKYVY